MSKLLPREHDEKQNYMLMIKIFENIIKKRLRELFKLEWNSRYQALLGAWDDTNASGQQLYYKEKSRSIAKNYYLTKFRNGDTSKWDCPELFDVILNSNSIGKMNLNPTIQDAVDNLRKIRNDVMQLGAGKLADIEFEWMVPRVKSSFKVLGLSDTHEIQQIVLEKTRNQSLQTLPPRPTNVDVDVPKKREIEGENDKISTVHESELKRTVKHRQKIKILRSIDNEKLAKVKPPLQYFSPDVSTKLGSGSDGTIVYIGIMKDGSEVAVKRMLTQSLQDAAENEKKILSLINTKNSPYIVTYRDFFKDDTFMYLILDLCEETLEDIVYSRSKEFLQRHGPTMIKGMLTGLEFLHDQKILHIDLKPSNVLVDLDGRIRLADFGISRVLKDGKTTHYTNPKGTKDWMAAEVIEAMKQKVAARYKKKSDVQVVGMIAFFILTKGEHPFGDSFERMINIVTGNPVNLEKLDDDLDARHFVSWLISHKLEERPYAHEALKHSFLNGVAAVLESRLSNV